MSDNKKIKKFYSTIASCILGEATGVSVHGSRESVSATKTAINSSKVLYEALGSKDTTLSDIENLLVSKEKAARKFERVLGIPWLF